MPKNSACSRSCTSGLRSVRSNSAGTCQASSTPLKSTNAGSGERPTRDARRRRAKPRARTTGRRSVERERPQEPWPRPAEQEQRRRDHRQQDVLDHVHPEEPVGVARRSASRSQARARAGRRRSTRCVRRRVSVPRPPEAVQHRREHERRSAAIRPASSRPRSSALISEEVEDDPRHDADHRRASSSRT